MTKMNRRELLIASASGAALLCLNGPARGLNLFSGRPARHSGPDDISGHTFPNDAPPQPWKWSCEAFAYRTLGKDEVICEICPHHCLLAPGDRSICRSKVNINGKLYSLAYGNACAAHVDPVEKKPLFHFKPHSLAFSIAAAGCNFRCLNCQNWEISQQKPDAIPRHYDLFPNKVVAAAQQNKAASIAYTYSEPTTFFEYMYDTARIARQNNIANLWISNGYINQAPLQALCKVLDAANVNLKAYSDDIYRKLNGGRLQPVLDTFQTLHQQKIHFEITNLVVPEYTDDEAMVKKMCGWILNKLGPDYPLHFLRFTPRYKLKRLSPTPVSILTRFREIAMKEGVRYVYVGNVPDHEGQHTYCHNCHKLLIERNGYLIKTYNLKKDRCRFCQTLIPGVWA